MANSQIQNKNVHRFQQTTGRRQFIIKPHMTEISVFSEQCQLNRITTRLTVQMRYNQFVRGTSNTLLALIVTLWGFFHRVLPVVLSQTCFQLFQLVLFGTDQYFDCSKCQIGCTVFSLLHAHVYLPPSCENAHRLKKTE